MPEPRSVLTRATASFALAIGLVGGLAACSTGSPIDNIVGGAVDGLTSTAKQAVDDAVGDALGGAGISTDGSLPTGFPSADVPLVEGTVRGGGAGPDGSGWVVQVTATGADQFATAQAALEAAGYTASGVDVDSDSGFGTFTGPAYRVILTFSTQASDGAVIATYVVTPV